MGKKTWLKVKRGLVEDPKHRLAMGESIWVYLYILDSADWTTGKIPEWTDASAAEQMEMPDRTIRFHRSKLESLGYITARQRQHSQEITINNWTDPRSYSGDVMNGKQGGKNLTPSQSVEPVNALPPSEFQGDNQGDKQGGKNLTPISLYIPHDHITTQVPAQPEPIAEAASPRVCQKKTPPPGKKPEARRVECPTCRGMVPVLNTNQGGPAAICMTCKLDVLTAEKAGPDENTLESDTGKCVEYYKHVFHEKFDRWPHVTKGKDRAIMRELVTVHGKQAVQEFIRGFLAIDEAELRKAGWPISWIPSRINSLIVKQKPMQQATTPTEDLELREYLLGIFSKRKEGLNH